MGVTLIFPFFSFSSHIIIAPKYVRPDMTYRMSVGILDLPVPSIELSAIISNENFREGISSSTIKSTPHSLNMLEMQVPNSAPPGNYSLTIRAVTVDSYASVLFENKTELFFKAKQVSIFLQTDKVIYGRLQYSEFALKAQSHVAFKIILSYFPFPYFLINTVFFLYYSEF